MQSNRVISHCRRCHGQGCFRLAAARRPTWSSRGGGALPSLIATGDRLSLAMDWDMVAALAARDEKAEAPT